MKIWILFSAAKTIRLLRRLQAKLLIREIRETQSLSPVFLFSCLVFLMGHSIIIVHSSPFLPRFRSLWATCMTVTMTASGAQLLLLALCVCRGSAMQQSAPRVRLSFKGELIQINQNSSDSRNCHPSDFSLVFPTRTHQLMLPCFLFIHL